MTATTTTTASTTAPAAPPSAPEARPVTTPAAPAAPAPPEAPAAQIVRVVTPLRQAADGSYRLAVQLHPAELGRVDLDIELRQGSVHLRIDAESEQARDALRAALPELRRELEAGGFRPGALDLGARPDTGTPGQPSWSNRPTPRVPHAGLDDVTAPAVDDAAPATAATNDAGLDLRI